MLNHEKLRQARKRKGLSQAKLAELVGVSQGLIWKIEHGITTPGVAVLTRMAQVLELSLDELLPVVAEVSPRDRERPDTTKSPAGEG